MGRAKMSYRKDLGRYTHIESGKSRNIKTGNDLKGQKQYFYLWGGMIMIISKQEFFQKYRKESFLTSEP